MRASRFYRSGEMVPESGVYAVLHSTPHALIQHVTHIAGTRFHECKLCPLGVWFRLELTYVPSPEQVWMDAQAA